MPNTTKDEGITGASFKEVWLPDVLRAEREAEQKAFEAKVPPMTGAQPAPPYDPPWTSLGLAPTDQNLKDAADGGSA